MSSLLDGIQFLPEGSGRRSDKKDKAAKKDKKKHKHARHEPDWLNPLMEKRMKKKRRSRDDDGDDSDRKHRKREKRKHKSKRRRASSDSDSDSDSSDSGDHRKQQPPAAAALPRDEWMEMPFLAPEKPNAVVKTAEELQQEADARKVQEEIAAGVREPVTGMYYRFYDPKNPTKHTKLVDESEEKVNRGGEDEKDEMPLFGYGGASWRAKMLQRAKERARASGKPLEEIVRQQFGGTLEELERSAEGSAGANAHLDYRRPDRSARPESSERRDRERRTLPVGRDAKDKQLLSSFSTRVQHAVARTMDEKTTRGNDKKQKSGGDDDEEEEPIDYSKLPDFEERHGRFAPARESHSRHDKRSPRRRYSRKREEQERRRQFLYGKKETATAEHSTEQKEEEVCVQRTAATHESAQLLGSSGNDYQASVDLNKLAAKALRAQMMGKTELFHKLKEQLNELEAQREASATATAVPHFEAVAGAMPALEKEDMRYGSRKGKKKASAQDDNVSLEELVRRERMSSAHVDNGNMDAIYARNIVRLGGRYKGTEFTSNQTPSGFDEEDQIDTRLMQRPEAHLTKRAAAERERAMFVSENKRFEDRTQKCAFCMPSPVFKKHLMLSLGEYTYLAIPSRPRLNDGHCFIAPIEHVPSFSQANEQVCEELNKFKRALARMYRKKHSKSVIFMEQTGAPHKRRHSIIECIPVPDDVAQDTPLFFKQELMQVDEEWSTHKKIIDTSEGGIKRHVPPQFAYFHIEWVARNGKSTGGYAHVIEDEAQFPRDFGVNVVAGMLDVEPPKYGHRNADQRKSFEDEKNQVLAFLKDWERFDWTQDLDGGGFEQT
ncbi:TPA: hypothetical protein N0F65_011161 [Lagenidium giganteum]|uniref:CWF19-like protein 2 n=1 Tax=Lagenidium giganteum TaxID=4803 RepID=A0AAV2Z7U9_9STRA|nr:TPA: hypothetical protein N0F65_011161 [Lagenidium giganteum]